MRLLNVVTLEFTEFSDEKIPIYAIASHRWQEEEVTYQEVKEQRSTSKSKMGYQKVRDFAAYVKDHVSGVKWLWIDTCCINKESAAELSEAINLMFKWYYNAKICLAYLTDVGVTEDKQSFQRSEWFERGWTLQELLAPLTVVFVTKHWQVIGNKGASSNSYSGSPVGPGLEREIAARTGIPEHILHNYNESHGLSIDERLKWMEDRKTSRAEDMSYALFGIFSVTPGANYGEGLDGARRRLLSATQSEKDLEIQQAQRAREMVAQRAERFRSISIWLSPPDPWTNHKSARKRHEQGTGTWLLESKEYQEWRSNLTRHFWLFGKAGCGKTVLCSTAIEDVKRHCESAANAGYAIFYLSFSDQRKQCYEDALLSWVVQLCWRDPALLMLQQAYEKPNRVKPGQDELEKILLACVETYDEVFLLIDALDECPESGDVRHYMMECLARLPYAASQLKILATSRELPDIRESMITLGAEPISIETYSVDADICKYMATQLSRDHRLSRLDPATKALIQDTISHKADGMFRWAFCQMQELKKLKSTRPRYVKDALYSLPATLDETYERMLTGIDEKLRGDALKLLRWLAYANSPPSLCELVDATVIDLAGDGNVEVDDRPGLDDTLEILSGLVTIIGGTEGEDDLEDKDDLEDEEGSEDDNVENEDDLSDVEDAMECGDEKSELVSRRQQIREDTKVRLAHFSVKEYLESKRILEGSAKDFYFESLREHEIISQSCLIYLMHYSRSEEKSSTKQDLTTFPLLLYAAQSWFYHARLQKTTQVIRETRFLSADDTLRDWLRIHQPDNTWAGAFRQLEDVGSCLYYASVLGLGQVVVELLAAGVAVNAQGGLFGNALQAASNGGHEKVVQMLLAAGTEVNAQGGLFGNALQAASYRCHEKVVQMLMKAGATDEMAAEAG